MLPLRPFLRALSHLGLGHYYQLRKKPRAALRFLEQAGEVGQYGLFGVWRNETDLKSMIFGRLIDLNLLCSILQSCWKGSKGGSPAPYCDPPWTKSMFTKIHRGWKPIDSLWHTNILYQLSCHNIFAWILLQKDQCWTTKPSSTQIPLSATAEVVLRVLRSTQHLAPYHNTIIR